MRDAAPALAELRRAAWAARRSLAVSVAGVRGWADSLLDVRARVGFVRDAPGLPALGLDGLLDPLADSALPSGRGEEAGAELRAADPLEVGEWVRPGTPRPGAGDAGGGGSPLETRTSLPVRQSGAVPEVGLMGPGGDPYTAGPGEAPSLRLPSTLDPKTRRAGRLLQLSPTDRVDRWPGPRSETSDRSGPPLGPARPIPGAGAGPGSPPSSPRDPTPSELGRAWGEEGAWPAALRRREIGGPISNFVPPLPGRPARPERAGEPGTSPLAARDALSGALRIGDRLASRTASSGPPPGLPSSRDDPAEGFPGRRGGSVTRIADVLGTAGAPAGRQELVDDDPSLDRMVRLLEDVVGELGAISARLTEGGNRPLGSGRSEPAVRWLEDDELAGRLQRILMRQARSRGIDLS